MTPAWPWRGWLDLALSLLALNILLTLANLWPTPWVRPTATLSRDLAGLVLLLVLLAELRGAPGRWLGAVLPTLLLALLLGHYAQITLAGLFGRPIDLTWDLRHLPSLLRMAGRVTPGWLIAVAALAVPLALVGLWLILRALGRPLLTALEISRQRRVLALGAAGLLLLSFAMPKTWLAPSLAVGAWAQATKAMDNPGPAEFQIPVDFGALGGRDLYVLFWESYGATVLDDPTKRAALVPAFDRLAESLQAGGWRSASALVLSPTFGGGSWLAHGSILFGRMLRDETAYREALAAPGDSLADQARAAGYRAVALMPGLKGPWPEGARFGFARLLDAAALGYQGPAYGWWAIPDQFSLERLYQEEIAAAGRRPLFAVFASVMSHIPFGPTPAYHADWSEVNGVDQPSTSNDTPAWTSLQAAYLDAMAYNIQWLGGFLRQRAPADAVVVVLGDHQPPALISGPGASWAVPVHVFSRDATLISHLAQAGFLPGLTPPAEPSGDMADLMPRLFSGLSGDNTQTPWQERRSDP